MHRFYVSVENIKDDIIRLIGSEAKHAFLVLRLKKGDEVVVFDGQGRQYWGTVSSCNKQEGIVKITKVVSLDQNEIRVVLAQAIPKKAKFDDIVDKATQLGVACVIPLLTENTVVKVALEKRQAKQERWQKIALEAAKQCGRGYVPEISPVTDLKIFLTRISEYNLILIGSLESNTIPIKEILSKQKPQDVLIFVGPEGDFSKSEIQAVEKLGGINVSLGQRVLRCDTAANTFLSVINYEWQR
ncbi:MAG: 16S rRNA (uracil(1498)-N(3))-methyltransferase [PVC group bacterium]|nr:16S rRNA (uracil(1498)-N(3))-methyltransferase [PVC group bacterium]